MPSILAQAKGYHGEKVISSFEASRKRLLGQEQEETERDDRERGSHPEKRARISAGEKNVISHTSFRVFSLNLYKFAMTLRNFFSVHLPTNFTAHPLIKARSASNGEPL